MASLTKKRRHTKKFKKGGGITNAPDDEELFYLEKIVLKTGSEVFDASDASEEASDCEISSKQEKIEAEKKPAWIDEDDDVTFEEVVKKQGRRINMGVNRLKKYQEIMEQKYQEVMGVPKWSKKRQSTEQLLNTCGKFIKKAKFLDKNILEYKTLKHLNAQTLSEGNFINVVKFHPKSTVAMVAGNSGLVSLFQVNGKENPKLQSIQFHNYPVHCGSFLKQGEELITGSQFYKYFYCYDLMTGKSIKVNNSKVIDMKNTKSFCVSPNDDFIAVSGRSGAIHLFTVRTKEYIDSFQMNCEVTALNFNHNGSFLFSHGEDGEVYVWDMKSRSCTKKFYDDGCLVGTSICSSNSDQFIACGSNSGVVNVYNTECICPGKSTSPIKTIYNLVTPVTSLQFNSTSEILVMASNVKDSSVKLLHSPSMTVFSNFPQFSSKIKKPLCVDFSPNSGFLAIGDDKGSAHLIRLKYYGNY